MSLSAETIDRLFIRLSATYGAAWDRNMGSSPIADVKTVWAHELSGFASRLHDVAWALEHLPERSPNVLEFKAICRRAPAPEMPRIEVAMADPELVKAELAKLQPLKQGFVAQREDKGWARALVKRAEAGDPIRPLALKFARQALGLEGRQTWQ